MATSQTQKLNAFAKQQGYKNYYELRKARAQAQGYRSLTEQRKARSTGEGLRGADASNPRYRKEEPRRVEPPRRQPPPTGRPPDRSEERRSQDARQRLNALSPKDRIEANLRAVTMREQMLRDRQARIAQDPRFELKGARRAEHMEEMEALATRMGKDSLEFFDLRAGPLARIYQDAALAANPSYKLDPTDAQLLQTLSSRGQRDLLAAAQFARQDTRRFVGEAKERATNLDKPVRERRPEDRKTTSQWANENGVKAKIYANGQRHSLGSYAELSMRAAAQRAHNLGVANASGVEWFQVSDGSDCGWQHHDDPDKANGSLRSLEDVLAFPIAHPNCSRQVVPVYEGGPKGRGRRAAEILGRGLQAQATYLAQDLASEGVKALLTNKNVQSRVQEVAARAVPGAWAHRVEHFLKTQKATVPEGTIDLNAARLSKQAAEQAIADAQYDLAEGVGASQRLKGFIGVEAEQLPKAVGDQFDQFLQYHDRTVRAKMSLREAVDLGQLEQFAYEAAGEYFGSVGNRVARFTFPKLGSADKVTGARFAFEPNDLIRATVTKTQRGIVNHLGLNPHGLFRAGIARNPETGLWSPTMRLVPKGPIRVMAKVNRSKGRKLIIENLGPERGGRLGVNVVQEGRFQEVVRLTTDELYQLNSLDTGDTLRLGEYLYEKLGPDEVLQGRGRVTSVSWEAKVITKTPVNFSANFNLNLRKLGLHNWQDIRNLRPGDLAKFRPEDLKFISAAAEVRAGGMGPFDLARTFRITPDRAQELWELTNQWLEEAVANPTQFPEKIMEGIQDQIADTVARRRREKFVSVFGDAEWDKMVLKENMDLVRDRIDNSAWFEYGKPRGTYAGTQVVDTLDGEVGEVIGHGPSYVTVQYEEGVVKYQWDTVNERTKILTPEEE